MIHVIVNSSSGSEKGAVAEKIVKPYLRQAGETFEIHYSEKPGDIAKIAAELTENTDSSVRIILIGGDGSINELLTGIKDTKKVILSIIPTGSGNDFAKSVGIPKDIKLALDIAVKRGRTAIIDLGEITYSDGTSRKFIISSGMGFDAAVCEEAMHSGLKKFLNKFGLGRLSYGSIAVGQIFGAKRPSGTISIDGGPETPIERVLFTAFMNEPFEGGGFKFGPNASHTDGKLDIILVERVSGLKFFFALPFAISGKVFMFKDIKGMTASRIRIRLDEPVWVHTDGEVTRQADELNVRVLRSAVNITLP
ncbi:MAG: diacylglycerol kinase family lipid kinase [Lachnospiraceae bacterium]|nr:diacylglycerol kinase family lipid kinase [Lachnospiraceae bacterium]